MKQVSEFFLEKPTRAYRRNNILVDVDQHAQGLYYIVEGSVKVVTYSTEGRERIMLTLSAGDFLPLPSFIRDLPSAAAYVATTEARLAWRSREDLDLFFHKEPEVLREMLGVVLELFYTRMTTLSFGDAEHRVISRLLELGAQAGCRNDGAVTISTTQQDLAASVNLSRESACRILVRIKNLGIVALRRSSISIDIRKATAAIFDA